MPTINVRFASNVDELKRNLKEGLNQIEAVRASTDKMVQSLGGGKLIQAGHNFAAAVREIGGAHKLTNAELERGNRLLQQTLDKYRALGQQAPTELRKIAAAIQQQQQVLRSASTSGGLGGIQGLLGGVGLGGVPLSGAAAGAVFVTAARSALNYADALTKLSDRTGIGTVALQRLGNIAEQSGNSIDDIAEAVNRLQRNLVENSKGTQEALARIGLTVNQLRVLAPEEQFAAIAKGIQTIPDPAERAALAMEIFGRAGASILPSLTADVDKLSKSFFEMSESAVKSLDEAGDAFQNLKRSATNALGEILAAYLKVGEFQRQVALGNVGQFLIPTNIPRPPGTDIPLPPGFRAPGAPSPEEEKAIIGGLNVVLAQKNALTKEAQLAYLRAQLALAKWSALWEPSRKLVREFSSELADLTSRVFDFQSALDEAEINARSIGAGFMDLPDVSPSGRVQGVRDEAAAAAAKRFQETQSALFSLGEAVSRFGSIAGGVFGDFLAGASSVIGSIGGLRESIERFGASSLTASLSALQLGFAIGQILAPAIISALRAIGNFFKAIFTGNAGAFRDIAEQAASRVPGAATGGLVTNFGIQRFAVGGMVQPSFGRDSVHIMAEPGEVILNRAQQAAMASGAGGVSVHVTVNAPRAIALDKYFLKQLGRMIAPEVAEAVSQNKNSAYTKFRAATGMAS